MKLKRIMAIVLCFAMVLSTMSFTVFAEDASTLPEAVEGVITLTEDVTLSETYKIEEGTTLTIDLNGYTINVGYQSGSSEKHIYAIDNYGTLTLTGDGTINSRGVGNYGTLTIENGTYNSIDTNGGSAVWNYSGSELTIEEGTFTAADASAAPAATALYLEAGATADVKGGTFTSEADWTYAIISNGDITIDAATVYSEHGAIAAENGTLIINSGSYNISGSGHVVYVVDASVTIKDGSFSHTQEDAASEGNVIIYTGTLPVIVEGGNFDSVNAAFAYASANISLEGGSFTGSASKVYQGGTGDNVGSFAEVDTVITIDGVTYVKSDDGLEEVKPTVATVNGVEYADIQEAIAAAAPSGTVEIVSDIVVDEWKMISSDMTHSEILTIAEVDGLTINGNNYTLTVNSIVSGGNGGYLVYGDVDNLNINDLTIVCADGVTGGIGLESGTISNVTFDGGVYGVFPGEGNIEITGCTFNTNGSAIYYEAARDALVVDNNTFEIGSDGNVILLRGSEKFTNNTVISGRTVNVVSGSPVVTGNNFGDVRLKVYNAATATIEDNEINVLAFNDDSAVNSTFGENTLSAEATQNLIDAGVIEEAVLSGSGTEADPYVINNIDDLVKFRNDVNAGNTYEGKYVLLTADIDFEGYTEMNVSNVSAPTFRPIGDHSCGASFNGTFDGGEHVISNFYVSGWDLNYYWGSYGSVGLFGTVENATIKNLTMEGIEIQVEGGDVAAIAGHAIGDCTFENITVTDSKIATYNNGCAGIIAWSEAGDYTFKDINITDSVVLAGLWGSFDSSIGGILAQADDNATYTFKNVDVACRLDCYNDVTAAYKYYNYRMCGMLIGRSTRFIDGTSEVNADNITCENVTITIGEWANYTYIWDDTLSYGCKRVEPGYTYDGINVEDYPDAEITMQPMTSIIGGNQYGYNGSNAEEIANQGFDETEIKVVDLAEVVRNHVVAQIGDEKFGTLEEAIASSQPDDTIILLDNVIEDVTIDKNITLDGADFDYSGTMNLNAANITIQNVDFVGGKIYKGDGTKNSANITIKDCDFDGQNTGGYAVELRLTGAIVIENCTAKDYVTGFLQVPKSNNSVSIKDVTIDGTSYAIKIDYSNGVSLENVTIEDSTYGFVNSNYGTKTIAVKNCTIKADYPLVIWDRNTTKVNTFKFEGDNDFGSNAFYYQTVTEDEMAYTKYVLGENATLTAVADLDVTTDNDAYFVKYVDGTYKSAKAIAQVGDVKYESLAEAIAVGGNVILLADVEDASKIVVKKDVSLDLNGKTISGTCNASQAHLFMVNNGATMTIEDSSAEKTGKITYAGDNSTGWIVDVEGKFVLESGTLELTGTWNIGYAVDVRPNAWGTPYTEETSFVMNGGKIVSSDGAVRVASSSSDIYDNIVASFTMNGGEIEAAWDGVFVQQSNAAWDVLNVTINNGTIKSELNPVRFYGPAATSYVNGEDCVDIALNGGTLTYTGTEELEWLVDGILRIGGGVTADDFLKDSSVTASADFATTNVAEGYSWVSIGRKYRLQTLGEYSFVVEADKEEIIDSGSFNVEVKVSSEKVDNFHSTEYIVTYDYNLLTCAEDNGATDFDSTTGTLRLQCLDGADVNEVIGTLNFTTKEFYLTQETEIKVSGIVCATQYDAAVGTSEPVSDGAVVVLLKDSFNVTVGAGLEGDAVAYNKTDYVVSVATENQDKQNTIKYTIKDANGNPVENSVILPAGTNEYTISGDDVIGDMTFEITDTYSIEIITDYVTGYALILVDGSADGYTYNGHQMLKINRASGSFEYDGRYGWLVDGSAPGTTLESVEAAAYAAIRAGEESKAVETGYDVNSYINGDGKINFYDVSAAYACQKIDFALSDVDDYFYMELYLASDANCDGKVDSSDSAVISVNYN